MDTWRSSEREGWSAPGSTPDDVTDRVAVPGGRGDAGLAEGRLLQLARPGLGQLTGHDLHEAGRGELRHPGRAPVEQLHGVDGRTRGVAVIVRPIEGAMAEAAVGGQEFRYVPK